MRMHLDPRDNRKEKPQDPGYSLRPSRIPWPVTFGDLLRHQTPDIQADLSLGHRGTDVPVIDECMAYRAGHLWP